MKERERREGAHGGGVGHRGRTGQSGPGWVGLGWAAPRVKIPRHAQPQIGIQFTK
jgi:hypothetical protein